MKKSPLNRRSKRPHKVLRRNALKSFRDYIKARDKYKCVTCGKQMAKGEARCHCGHYEHGDCMDFDERNNNCQCNGCNTFKGGKRNEYAIYLESKYGYGILQELAQLKRQPRKFTREELIEMKEYYEQCRKELENVENS